MKFPIQKVGKWESMAGLGDGEILLNFFDPIGSMYGMFTYISLICMVNVGKCR